jgi:tetracycline resistance efflux pump
MHEYGFWSILPPVLAIVLAIATRQVFISLLLGVWLGWMIIHQWSFTEGTIGTIEALVDVFKDAGNTRTIMFCSLVGALIAFIQRSGGVVGFNRKISNLLEYYEQKKKGKNIVVVQLLAWLTGLLIFVETSISILTVGALYRPIFDKLKISREKLAYIADSSSAPSSILVPFNAWGAYIMGLLIAQGFENPFAVLFKAFPFNFYPIFALTLVLIVIIFKKDFGPMAKAEKRTKQEGKLLNDGATPVVDTEITVMEPVEGIKHKARNMLIPILTMVGMMPVLLIYTGWGKTETTNLEITGRLLSALSQGSGSAAVLYAVLTSLLVAFILYRSQKIMKSGEMIDLALKGISGLIPLALLMMLAFAISHVSKELGTGIYIADVTKTWLSPNLVPAIVFVVSCFIAFSTGTSWGTFAIMISIAVPMATTMDANVYVVIAAALGGGVFGDHCSPISDTTILASMASATDHIDHVKTQLPYALLSGTAALLLYLFLGFLG